MRIRWITLLALLFVGTAQVSAEAASPACALASEGIYGGYWVKHRIYLGEDVLYGANNMDAILKQLESLREQGVCR